MESLGHAIRLGRAAKNISQREMAKKAGLSLSYISLLENGQRDPSFSTLQAIASALEVPIVVLVVLATDEDTLYETFGRVGVEKIIFRSFSALMKGTIK